MTDEAGGIFSGETPTKDGYTAEFLEELGRYLVGWSRVEHLVQRVCIALMGLDERTALVLVGDLSLTRLIDRCRGIAHESQLQKADRQALLGWLDQVAAVRIERNQIVHGAWVARWGEDRRWSPAQLSYRLRVKKEGNAVDVTRDGVSLEALRAMTGRVGACMTAYNGLPQHLR